MNKRNFFIFILLFFQRFLIKSTKNPVIVVDNEVAQYFDKYWVDNIKKKRNTIIVKMNKIKMGDGAELEDYDSIFKSEEKILKHNGHNYRIKITVSPNHNLTYDIKKEQGTNLIEITDENDKKIFYNYTKKNEKDEWIIDESSESFLSSENWVLAKIKPKDEDNYFYVFINNIDYVENNSGEYCCLGHWANIEEFYFIYSKINNIDGISRTLEGASINLENINFQGLNFYDENYIKLSNWFEYSAIKKIHNFPNFNKKIDIKRMLIGCKKLEDINLGNNIIDDASSCFIKCENLKNVNLENTSITENANLSNMFNHCKISENLEGIETLVKENDKPNINCMFFDCKIVGNLDLSKWGTNMKSYKYLFSKANLENLTLFNLKKLIKKNKETRENNKKKIDEFYKKHPDKNLNSKIKSLVLLEMRIRKEILTNEEMKKKDDLQNDDEIKKVENLENYKKEFEDIIKMELENGELESPDILKGSTIRNLNIKEEFMPQNKKDLDKILGDGYNITGDINIIKSNGEIVKYKSFNDYPFKEQEPSDPIDQQIPEDIKEEEIPKGNTYLLCCSKCCSKCCCYCHNKNKRKRSNSI